MPRRTPRGRVRRMVTRTWDGAPRGLIPRKTRRRLTTPPYDAPGALPPTVGKTVGKAKRHRGARSRTQERAPRPRESAPAVPPER